MSGVFSKEVKDILVHSSAIALTLGYDHVSTVHLFLADCKLNNTGSVRNFAFKSDGDFQTFYANQRIGESTILSRELPLTLEAEKTVRKAFKLWIHSNYFDKQVRPYHLFIAAALIPHTYFHSIFSEADGLHEKLEQYYIRTGQIDENKIHKSFRMRFRQMLQGWMSGRI